MKKTLYLAFLMCLVPSLGFTAQKDKVTEGIYDMGGRKLIDRSVEVTGALQVDKWLELINESTPSTPASTHARFFYNNAAQKLCVVFGDGTQTCLGPGTVGGSGFLAGATQPIVYNSTTNILSATLISLSTGVVGILPDANITNTFTSSKTFTSDILTNRLGIANIGAPGIGYVTNINGGIGITNTGEDIYLSAASSNVVIAQATDLAFIAGNGSGRVTLVSSNTISPSIFLKLPSALPTLTHLPLVLNSTGDIYTSQLSTGDIPSDVAFIDQSNTFSSSQTITSPSGLYVTYGASLGSATLRNVASGTQCLHADSSGNITGTGSDCGSASTGAFLASTQTFTGTNTFNNAVIITSGAVVTSSTNACGYLIGTQVQTVFSSSTISVGTNSATYAVTNTTVTINPRCITDKIIVSAVGTIQNPNPSTNEAMASLFRDSTDLFPGTSLHQGFAVLGNGGLSSQVSVPASVTMTDTPNTVAGVAYNVRIKANTGGGNTMTWGIEGVQYISLTEIAR